MELSRARNVVCLDGHPRLPPAEFPHPLGVRLAPLALRIAGLFFRYVGDFTARGQPIGGSPMREVFFVLVLVAAVVYAMMHPDQVQSVIDWFALQVKSLADWITAQAHW